MVWGLPAAVRTRATVWSRVPLLRSGRPCSLRAAEFRGAVNFGNYVGRSGDSLKGPDKGSRTPNPGRRPSQEQGSRGTGWAPGRGSGKGCYRSCAPSGCGHRRGPWPPEPEGVRRPGGGRASAPPPAPRCRRPRPAPAGRGPGLPPDDHPTASPSSRAVPESPPPLGGSRSREETRAGAGIRGGTRGGAGPGKEGRGAGPEVKGAMGGVRARRGAGRGGQGVPFRPGPPPMWAWLSCARAWWLGTRGLAYRAGRWRRVARKCEGQRGGVGVLSIGAGVVGDRPHRGRVRAADWPVRVVSWSSGDVGTGPGGGGGASFLPPMRERAPSLPEPVDRGAEVSGRMGRDDDPGVSVSTVTCLHAQGTTHVKYKVQDKLSGERVPPPPRPRPHL